MSHQDGIAGSWIANLQKHTLVVAGIVVLAIVSGASAFLSDVKNLLDFLPFRPMPKIEAFTLSPSATGFEEREDNLFGASENQTFNPVYPFEKNPVAIFLITVSNPQKTDLVITSVIYDIHQVGEVAGGTPGPLVALTKYNHRILHESGRQKRGLVPPFRIPTGDVASFEIQITSMSPGSGLGWYMRLGFVSNEGTFYTNNFQLFLPKSDDRTHNTSESTPDDSKIIQSYSNSSDSNLNQSDDILSRRRASISIPDPSFRDCVFERVGILAGTEKLDKLDKDMLYLRAGTMPIDEFERQATETTPPIPYQEMISNSAAKRLLTIIKTASRAGCP